MCIRAVAVLLLTLWFQTVACTGGVLHQRCSGGRRVGCLSKTDTLQLLLTAAIAFCSDLC